MKLRPLLYLSLAFFLLTQNSWAHQAKNPCQYYLNKAKSLGCNQDNYLIKFGFHYCQSIDGEQGEFSPHGIKVFSKVRNCLIKSLKKTKHLNCTNVKAIAEKSHISCYIQSGYCSLAVPDKWDLFELVWEEFFDKGFRRTARKIIRTCRKNRVKKYPLYESDK